MRPTNYSTSRRRYQRGQLIRDGERWLGRWREDVVTASGEVKRPRKKEFLGTIEDFPTQRLAQRELDRRLDHINSVEYRPSRRVTFAVFAQRWQEKVMVHQKRSSQSSARSLLKVHLLPVFGEMNLGDIRMQRIQEFATNSKATPKMVRNAVTLLMSMWSTAQGWEYVQHNPFLRNAAGRLLLRLPTVITAETYHFTVGEALAIIDKAEGQWKTFFRILAETGMRPGELAGLRRDAVGVRTTTITQSVWGQKVQTPKSKAGVRTFAFSASLSEEVRNLVAAANDNEYGLVFVTAADKPLSMDNFRQRVLNPILDDLGIREKVTAMGIKRCGNYAFRHMNATLMDTISTPMKTRMKRLGHAQIETTLKHYTHAMDADDRRAAEQISASLSPKGEQTADSPGTVPADNLALPAALAEIARQLALFVAALEAGQTSVKMTP